MFRLCLLALFSFFLLAVAPASGGLFNLAIKGQPLEANHGQGALFGEAQKAHYRSLKDQTLKQRGFRIQWALMDLDREEIIHQSPDAGMRFYGASVSKLFVAASLLDKHKGLLTPSQLQDLAELVVISSNRAWRSLQMELGDGNETKGMIAIRSFTRKMGYTNTEGYRGLLDGVHGNEVNALELCRLLADTYHKRYYGAATLWAVMQTTRTGTAKIDRYMPADFALGGKTGSYTGQTIHPYDHKPYFSNVHHHAAVFKIAGTTYGLVILTDGSQDEEVAVIGRGLIQEYLNL